MPQQGELDFAGDGPPVGYDHWQEQRRRAARVLARRLGLPLNHPVEVWLKDGIRLRGTLHLNEETLFLKELTQKNLVLRIDNTPFTYGDIESCVRQD